METIDKTLDQFLLERFMGALLDTLENIPIIPGTVGAMASKHDLLLCD